MLAVSLGLLLVGSGVSVHIEEHPELPLKEATSLAEELAGAIEARSRRRGVVDDPVWPQCKEVDRCVEAIRARTKTEDVVLLRMYAGPTKIRLIAERLSVDGLRDARLEENVSKDTGDWPVQLAVVAERLFPERPLDPSQRLVQSAPKEDDSVGFFDVAPWVFLGGAVVSFGVGTGFGVSNRSARDELTSSNPPMDDAFNDTFNRMRDHGTIANALFITGGVSAAVGGLLLLLNELI